MITLSEIKNKDHVRYGKKYEGSVLQGHKADIVPGEKIRIYGQEHNHIHGPQDFDLTFKIGDWAEYDSYNLKYTGQIIAIGPKTVTIQAYPGTHNAENHQLNIYQFSWRNWEYNAEKIAKHNSEEMMCI